jgi:hypothetical protein
MRYQNFSVNFSTSWYLGTKFTIEKMVLHGTSLRTVKLLLMETVFALYLDMVLMYK